MKNRVGVSAAPKSIHQRFKSLVKLIAISQHLKSLLKVGAHNKSRQRLDLTVLLHHVPSACCSMADRFSYSWIVLSTSSKNAASDMLFVLRLL
jgi:hypothetical protein